MKKIDYNKLAERILFFTKTASREIFVVSWISYMSFFLLEKIRPYFVSSYIDLNVFFIPIGLSGFFLTLFADKDKVSSSLKGFSRFYFLFLFLVSFLTSLFVFFYSFRFTPYAFFVALICFFLTLFIGMLLLQEKGD